MRRTLLGFYFMAVVLLVLPMLSTTILAMEAVESGIGTSVSIVTTPLSTTTVPAQPPPLDRRVSDEEAIQRVVASVRGAVVQIVVENAGAGYSTGSGFIIDGAAHIVTNNHVVEGATVITVVMPDNSTAKARLVGADPQTDLAVLRIPGRNYPAVSLGVTKDVEVGETVVAIGSALGLPGGPTVTTGTVSALGRAETEPGDEATNTPGARLYDLIQTDTAINPGNSGGPLLNTEGKVVGVNTLGQRATSTGIPVQGINFAISVDTVRDVSAEIIRTGRVVYPYIGFTGRFLYPQVSIIESLPMVLGQRVESVEPGTPAEKVGFRRGDVILAIDGTKIIDESTFIRLLRAKNPGDSARFTIWRDGRTLQRELVLATRPNSP